MHDQLPPRESLTPAEETLIAAILAGRRAELDGQWIRAFVLRDLAAGNRPDWRAPPVGVSLNRAVIDGELDFEGCTVENPLVFLHCRFEPRASETAVLADGLRLGGPWILRGANIVGEVRFAGARFGRPLHDAPQRRHSSQVSAKRERELELSERFVEDTEDILSLRRLYAGFQISVAPPRSSGMTPLWGIVK